MFGWRLISKDTLVRLRIYEDENRKLQKTIQEFSFEGGISLLRRLPLHLRGNKLSKDEYDESMKILKECEELIKQSLDLRGEN